MPLFTVRTYRHTYTLEATTAAQLARRLYAETSWSKPECHRVALECMKGRVYSAPDYETLILPGLFHVIEDRPIERSDWRLERAG